MRDSSATDLSDLRGVGSKIIEKLAKLGIRTQRDLLFHLPLRYEDRTRVTAICALQPGQRGLIQAQVVQTGQHFSRQGRSNQVLTAKLADHSGMLTLHLFHFSTRQKQILGKGRWLRCYGEARMVQGELRMVHPEYQAINIDHPPDLEQNLTPIYPVTEGLHQLSMRKIVRQAVDHLRTREVSETLPQAWLEKQNFPDFKTAMLHLHHPGSRADTDLIAQHRHPAQLRFVVEELCAHRLALLEHRAEIKTKKTPQINTAGTLRSRLIKGLAFRLTSAQDNAVQDIMNDFDSGQPMIRLLQGDVGSGKTIVAALACLPVVESGFQCAVMAPTEILAEQHLQNFRLWLEPLGVTCIHLLGADKGKKRQQKVDAIASAEVAVVIGTHALFQASVVFKSLGLVVIDEQHRFGVDQRLALQKKTSGIIMPHQLIMTATPIPRTLAMSVYADLDHTKIDELPPGRTPVITSIVSEQQRPDLIERVSQFCQQGGQVFWVCTLIEESEALQCEAAEVTFRNLQQQLPSRSIALVHGRMKAAQKDAIVQAFKRGETDILVATTVIEVGVDVPNANIMIIENPERLGLSQIHQLRGRIGRGGHESFCILLVKERLSALAKQRLHIIRNHQDGFRIAEKDLELRGAGEVLGTRQTGEASFKIANLLRDQSLFLLVDELTALIGQKDCTDMRLALLRNWLGNRQSYTEIG